MTSQSNKRVWDIWLLCLKILIVFAYVSLMFMKPSGEGWGRGWNLVAYWIYLAPTVLVLGALHAWRQKVIAVKYNGIDTFTLVAAFIFPIIALIILKLKA